MIAKASAPDARTSPFRVSRPTRGMLLGIPIALAAWLIVYAASQAYLREANSLGLGSSFLLTVPRVVVVVVAFATAALALRWRGVAIGLVVGGGLALALSAYLRFVAHAPLWSLAPDDDPVRTVVNDLGVAMLEAVFYLPILFMSGAWIAIALAHFRPKPAEPGRDMRGRIALFVLGALVTIGVVWLQLVLARATLAMFVQRDLSPLQPTIAIAVGLTSTYVLMRIRIAALGAAAMGAAALVVSVVTGGAPVAFQNSLLWDTWQFSISDAALALRNVAFGTIYLVLLSSWFAVAVRRLTRRHDQDGPMSQAQGEGERGA